MKNSVLKFSFLNTCKLFSNTDKIGSSFATPSGLTPPTLFGVSLNCGIVNPTAEQISPPPPPPPPVPPFSSPLDLPL